MYPSVEALSETRFLNRASLSLSLSLSLSVSLSLRVRASLCAAVCKKRSASPETHANDKLSLYGG